MNKYILSATLSLLVYTVGAQINPNLKAYGKVDKGDLELKQCDFEKDANAEVLFDKATIFFSDYEIVMEEHVRIKIFNDNGKKAADVHFPYLGGNHYEWIEKLQAETINENADGSLELTKVDKKQIFDKPVDKERSELSIAFPNVKAGSIIEYKFQLLCANPAQFPDWYFQTEYPTRYSEIEAKIPDVLHFKHLVRVTQPFAVEQWDGSRQMARLALANVPSINEEPYMSSLHDNMQSIQTQLLSITAPAGSTGGANYSEDWHKVGKNETQYDDFGEQFKRKLAGEEELLSHVKTLKTDNEKISYIFEQVKNTMKWNDLYERYTDDGTVKAWEKKIGNSTEINLIVYHLLTKAGIKAYPLLVSTKSNGKANPAFPTRFQFNSSVVYIPVDSTTVYVLDATRKNNLYNVIPDNFLNNFGLMIDKDNDKYDMVFIQNAQPAREVILINSDITADGKMQGTAQINSFAYYRIDNIESYKKDGEKKYIENLKDGNNDLSIPSLKLDNMEADSLPLTQNVNFSLNLAGSDGTYIYFKPNLFTTLGPNPFLAEKRTTDIDFGYLNNYAITGNYKIPAGYKVDALPKSTRMEMPDQSISFRRLVVESDGTVTVRFTIAFRKSLFFKENYEDLRAFYKKLYELIDEQVILKKG